MQHPHRHVYHHFLARLILGFGERNEGLPAVL
jgi:hypothetical protein